MNDNPFIIPDAKSDASGAEVKLARAYYNLCESLLEMPSSRSRSVAITNLEQSHLWAVKSLKETKKD